MKECLITVIVPVYNSEKGVAGCLNSIINQTYKNLEIILVNDGSTDDSLRICEEAAKKDDRIKVFSIENQGVSVARNLGLKNAKGDYIMFVDSDDYVDTHIVEKLLNKTLETDADICQCGCNVSDGQGNILKIYDIPFKENLNKNEIVEKMVLPLFGRVEKDTLTIHGFCVCKLFRKSILKDVKFNENQRMYQDRCFNIDAYLSAEKTSFVDENLYYYVINPFSSTQRRRADLWEQSEFLVEALRDRIKCFSPDYEEELIERINKTACGRLVFVTRNIFKNPQIKNFSDAVKSVKSMRENAIFDRGVERNLDSGKKFYVLAKLLHYRLYLPAVLISKIKG